MVCLATLVEVHVCVPVCGVMFMLYVLRPTAGVTGLLGADHDHALHVG